MDIFPVELWGKIFQNVVPRHDRLAISTTCRLFYTIAQSTLYEHINIWNSKARRVHGVDFGSRMELRLAETLATRPELFGLVRTLTVDLGHGDVGELGVETCSSHPILCQLASFSRLRVLHLSGIYIDGNCYTAICSLPCLENLVVSRCNIDATLKGISSPHISGNVILKMDFTYHIVYSRAELERWTAIFPPGLRALHIVLNTGLSHSLLQSFVQRDVHKTLTNLNLCSVDRFSAQLCHFLELCTQLLSLSITVRPSIPHSSHLYTLSPRSLPMLAKIFGPNEYADMFLRGRPVYDVSLALYPDPPTDVLRALWLTSVPVSRLDLCHFNPAIDIGLMLGHAPITLHHLCLNDHGQEKIESWLPAFSRMTALRVVTFNAVTIGDGTSVPLQRNIVQVLSKACPSVREITFRIDPRSYDFHDDDENDNSRWIWRNDGGWEHYEDYF